MLTFEQYANFLSGSAARARPMVGIALARVGDHAVSLIGHYVGHELPQWPPLSPGYVAKKRSDGFTGRVSASDPWLRTGETRDSIHGGVEGHRLVIGSPLQKALWNEIGTSRAPPRPLLALALNNSIPFAHDVFAEAAIAMLVPPGARP